MDYPELKAVLDSYSSHALGKYPHRYLVFDLRSRCNSGLKEFLEKAGYWEFSPNRSRRLVGYHCIVAFFFCRKRTPNGVGDQVEVHHISGNTMDNRPQNLVYLSPRDHSIVTKYQRKLTKLKVKQFVKLGQKLNPQECTSYNRQGRRIRCWGEFIVGIICLTVSRSNQWLKRTKTPVLDILRFVNRWLKRTTWGTSDNYATS